MGKSAASTSNTIVSDSFRNALTAFRNRLEPHELQLFQQVSLTDLKVDLETIQKRQEVQKNNLGMSRLKGYLEATEQLGRIVEVFLNVSDAVAFVWGPVKLILQTASTWSSAFDKLLDAYQSIGEQFPLIEQYENLFGSDLKMQRVLELLYCDILEFHRRALPFIRKKIWKQVFRAAWNDFSGRFNEIITSIGRHSKMLESQAQLIHFRSNDAIVALLTDLEKEQRTASEKFEQMEDDRRNANFNAVRQWIGATSTESIHIDDGCARWAQYHGTAKWIIEEKQVSRWMNDTVPKDSALWIHGIPGAGKTVLTSFIIEKCKMIENANIVYFYCKFDDEQKNKSLSILKGLLAQTIVLDEDLVPYFMEKSRESREAVLSDEKMAKDLFEIACYQSRRQYIVLDGLDECSRSDRKSILGFLTALVKKIDSKDPGKLRLLVTSQTETDIARSLQTADFFQLRAEHNASDISKFSIQELADIQQKFGLADDQVQYIRRQVEYRASGQFLYARLVLNNLLAQNNLRDLINEIQSSRFPKELTEAYQRILDRVKRDAHPTQWLYIVKILGWMVRAARPMKWHEMQAALSMDFENAYVDFTGKSLKFYIKEVCGSFVGVDENDRTTLVHSTAKTFIVETNQITSELVELDLTARCLQYLTFPCFEYDISEERFDFYVTSGQYAFQDYAIAKWEQHFRQSTVLASKLQNRFREPEYEYAFQVLAEAINDFVLSYEEDFLTPLFPSEDTNSQYRSMEPLRCFGAFDSALRIYNHNNAHRASSPTAFNDVSLKRLQAAYDKSCKKLEMLLERTTSSQPTVNDLKSFYGSNPFKCSKLTCFHFHQGFPDAKSRSTHLDRHTRPFHCPISDCNASDLGFITKNNLDNHMRTYHPDLEDLSKSFPVQKTHDTAHWTHECKECNKKFARRTIFNDHMLAHAGQKPHTCKRCGKGFTRKNDRDRHERTIHAQRARLEQSFP